MAQNEDFHRWANAVSPFSALLTVSLAMALQLFVHHTLSAMLVYTISTGPDQRKQIFTPNENPTTWPRTSRFSAQL